MGKFAEVPEDEVDRQKNTSQASNTIYRKLARECCWICLGACETCQETTWGAVIKCCWRWTWLVSHRMAKHCRNKKCGKHTRTWKRCCFFLQCPSRSLYWQSLTSCQLAKEKCLQGPCPESPSESMKGGFIIERQWIDKWHVPSFWLLIFPTHPSIHIWTSKQQWNDSMFLSNKLKLSFEQVKMFSSFPPNEETHNPSSHYGSLALLMTFKIQRKFHWKCCYTQIKL